MTIMDFLTHELTAGRNPDIRRCVNSLNHSLRWITTPQAGPTAAPGQALTVINQDGRRTGPGMTQTGALKAIRCCNKASSSTNGIIGLCQTALIGRRSIRPRHPDRFQRGRAGTDAGTHAG